MKCSDVERVLPELLDGASDRAFPTDVESHVKSCPDCSDLVADLKLIATEARQLAANEEPAPRVWVRIAAELRAEGLIREPAPAPTRRPVVVPVPVVPVPVAVSSRWRWRALWLGPVAAAVLAAGAYVVSHKPAPQVALQQTPAAPASAIPASVPAVTAQATPAPTVPASAAQPASQQMAEKSAEPIGPNANETGPAIEAAAEPEPSAEDQQFLSVVSTLGASTRATYENQLKAVNAEIRETQAYVDRNPRDVDARQHLMDAYQQKALLYQIALDRIQ
jgi:hypothetical protein